MKFEMVEQPGWDVPADHHADVEEPRPTGDDDAGEADPMQVLKAGTARLVSDVRADAQQISECAAQISDLAAQAAGARIRQHSRSTAPPPANFRAARFGGSRRTPGPQTAFSWPGIGDTGSVH